MKKLEFLNIDVIETDKTTETLKAETLKEEEGKGQINMTDYTRIKLIKKDENKKAVEKIYPF